MKRIVMVLVSFFLVANSVKSQTWEEWFRQNRTQRKYLLQQIEALKIYSTYALKGYNIASNGIMTIRNIKDGDFNLHRDFLSALSQVNPKIKKYGKVADIITLQLQIIKHTKRSLREIQATKQFTQEEMEYCNHVFNNLCDESIKNIDELMMTITPNQLEMKDEERIKRLNRLLIDMQDKYAFSGRFCDDMGLLSKQRLASQIELKQSKIINNLR